MSRTALLLAVACTAVAPLRGVAQAVERSATAAMEEGYARKATGDLDGAADAFARAEAAGFDGQVVSLELAYVAMTRGRVSVARERFEAAAKGPDTRVAARARLELDALPRSTRGDLYAEAVGWSRSAGPSVEPNVVPMLRLRVLHAPVHGMPLDVYAFAQATRDLASRGGVAPRVYADDRAILGAGVQLRLFGGRAALLAQAGSAFALLDDGRDAALLDVRAGATGFAETRGCSPAAGGGARLSFALCVDGYGEALYLSRFEHDLVAAGRGRAGATWLTTGPVAWALLGEVRAAADRVGHPYDNFAEAGVTHRWRLLRPLRVDLLAGAHGGVFLRGRPAEPLPDPRRYLDLRLLAATYTEF